MNIIFLQVVKSEQVINFARLAGNQFIETGLNPLRIKMIGRAMRDNKKTPTSIDCQIVFCLVQCQLEFLSTCHSPQLLKNDQNSLRTGIYYQTGKH